MSRSYRKKYLKFGICSGSNTKFYRDMNRKCRNKNNHQLRNLLANHLIDEIDDYIVNYEPHKDDWKEPTDGTFLVSLKDRNEFISNPCYKHNDSALNWWNRKIASKLKKNENKRFKTNSRNRKNLSLF